MSLSIRSFTAFFALVLVLTACSNTTQQETIIVPKVKQVESGGTALSLANGFSLKTPGDLSPLGEVLEEEFYLLTGLKNAARQGSTNIALEVDTDLTEEAYALEIGEGVNIRGGSYAAVAMGLTSMLQLLNEDLTLPKVSITDAPDNAYRGLMLDLARGWHDMGVLKEIINLCQWYKLNYLHLHLTDDQSFTFPSTAYPALATEGRSFTLDQLKELNQYAIDRGVILMPEIDVPGHSTQFVRKMPELFGIGEPSKNSYTISMGKEEVYEALNTLITELAAAFPHSPYIHIGGDEAFFSGMEDDPETLAYMKANGIPNLDELFRHFLVRVNNMVRAQGRQTIVWAGFGEEGETEIPRNVIVMQWEPQYYDSQQLIDDGFSVINASFKPLYVVNNRKWDADYIYTQWNAKRWESWAVNEPFNGEEVVDKNQQILGGSMSVWEQNQINQVHRLRERLPAMAERLWNHSATDLTDFRARLTGSDNKIRRLLRPFEIKTAGRAFPEMTEGNFYEHLWFNEKLSLSTTTTLEELQLRHTLDGSEVTADSPDLPKKLEITETTTVKIQAFDEARHAVGQPFHQRYFLKPIQATRDKLWRELPPGSWEKLRFEEQMTIRLETAFDDYTLRYTLDYSAPTANSLEYTGPITIDKSTQVRAQLFDKNDQPFGSGFSEMYYVIVNAPSLTTGKPIEASNEHIGPGLSKKANNGRVTLWEQWGGHVGDHVWIKVDLEKPESISRFKIYNFWDGYRYYQYTIDGSMDGETWTQLVDFTKNTEKASIEGYEHRIAKTEARYLRINMIYNSANPGLHLVEFSAFE